MGLGGGFMDIRARALRRCDSDLEEKDRPMNEVIGVLGIVATLALTAVGMPIAFAMGLVGFLGFSYLVGLGAAFNKLCVVPFLIASSYDYSVIPLFMLMAYVISEAGFSRNLYHFAYKWLGTLPGGMAIATIAACAVFAAVSASSTATAVTIGLVALPEMMKLKYDPRLTTGSVAAGGTLGILIPPSGILILYGIFTEQSIGKLFIAGIIPGIIKTLFYMVAIFITCKLRPESGPPGPKSSFGEKMISLKNCIEIIALITLSIGGLLVGLFTPTEAGAVGAFGAIALALLRKRLTWARFWTACVETLRTTGMIYALLVGAFLLNFLMAASDAPTKLAEFVSTLTLHPQIVMLLIFVVYFILGCLMDSLSMILLTLPLFFPLSVKLGFDPIWFGIFIVVVVEIGMITPPVGLNVYAIAGLVKNEVPMTTIFRGIFPFLLADLCLVAVLFLFPRVALFLPNLIG
jgi:C4-dicarboxylate transporter, DctM subunit